MKKRLSLRLRLTLYTSLLLTLTCALFTVFGFYNARTNVVDTIAAQIITIPAIVGESEPLQPARSVPAEELQPLLSATVAPEATFGQSSFLFMGLIILLGSAGMFLLSGFALKPAKKLAREIAAIDRDNLSVRIDDFQGGDELQSISVSFNHMMERLEEAFLRESRFSAAAAHELKTPLTVIRTNLDVLALDETPAPEDYEASFQVVKNQTRRMNELVEQLSLLQGTGGISTELPVDLTEIAQEALQELPHTDRRIHADLKQGVVAAGNAVLLKHVFANLLHNALRYNRPEGEIWVSLEQTENTYTFQVKDTGIGIREEDVPHIFEPFYRAEASRSRALGGSGLGLAIVKEVVQRHGGNVSYQRNQPEGSVFTVTLPVSGEVCPRTKE